MHCSGIPVALTSTGVAQQASIELFYTSQISIGRICNVESSNNNVEQSRRPEEMVDSLFVRSSGFCCLSCCDGCRKPSRANRNNGSHRRCCYGSNSCGHVWRLGHIEECRYWQLYIYHHQLARSVHFSFSTTWKLFSLGDRSRISRDRQKCDCGTGSQRYDELANVDFLAESDGSSNGRSDGCSNTGRQS